MPTILCFSWLVIWFFEETQLSICHRTHISTETTCWLWQADSISIIDNKHYKILTVWSSQISNTDQTPLTFDLPSETTIPPKESKSVSICATGKKKYNIELVQIFRWKCVFELVQYTNVHLFNIYCWVKQNIIHLCLYNMTSVFQQSRYIILYILFCLYIIFWNLEYNSWRL